MKRILYIIIPLLSLLFLANHAQAGIIIRPVLNTGLVGYWDFQEGAGSMVYDKSGKGNNGTWNGTASHWVDGKLGKAGNFNGGDYVNVGNEPALQITGSMTISAWIYQSAFQVGDDDDDIFTKTAANGDTKAYRISTTEDCGGKLFGFLISASGNTTSGWAQRCSVTTPELSTWYHVVGVFNATAQTLDVYVNGVIDNGALQGTGVPASVYNTSEHADIGSRSGETWGWWYGKIDEVRIYNRALSESEIERLYKLSQPKMYSAPKNGLVGYWSFDEGIGTKVGDMSNNGNHGTWNGSGSHWADGKFGKGGNFNGSDDYVDAGSDSSIDDLVLSGHKSTFSFWINPDSQDNVILAKNDNNTDNGFWIENIVTAPTPPYGQAGLRFVVCSSGENMRVGVASPPNGRWTHVVIVFSGNLVAAEQKFYYNGVLQSLTTSRDAGGGNFSDGPRTMYIGNNIPSIGTGVSLSKFDGKIDEVRIYNRALEQSEITALYKTGIQKINASQNNQITNGLVGFWSFNGTDMESGVAFDRSGNGNDGTVSGATKTIGKVGQALSFDGVNDYIYSADSSSLRDLPNTALTFSAWVKANNDGTDGYLFVKAQSSVTNGWYIALDQFRRAQFGIQRQTTDLIVVGSVNTLPAYSSGWFHLAITYPGGDNASNVHIYVNGSEISGYSRINGEGSYMSDSGMEARIGRNAYSTYANVNIDEVRVYNRALEPSEIQRLYNLGR